MDEHDIGAVIYHMSGLSGERYEPTAELKALIEQVAADLEQCFDVVDEPEMVAAQVLDEMGVKLH